MDRGRKSIQDMVNAWIYAEHPTSPTIYKLVDLYEYLMLDEHLTAAIENNRKLPTLSANWILQDSSGAASDEKKALLQTEWFYDLVSSMLDSIFHGFTLTELQFDGKQVKDIINLERRCIIPQRKLVVPYQTARYGETWEGTEIEDLYIFRFKPQQWGLLLKAAPNVIYKRYAMAAWVEHAETFALPFMHAKTDIGDISKVTNLRNQLASAGRGRMAITDYSDELTASNISSSDAYRIYDQLAERCEKGISKLILGQTMTMADGSSRSQAEVHQDVLQLILTADMLMIETIVNTQLIPKLINLGYPLKGYRFCYHVTRELTLQDKINLYALLLQYYDISEEEIEEKFGVEVVAKAKEQASKQAAPVEQ